MVVLGGWLSKKIDSPWLAAVLGLVLIGLGINALVSEDMPTIVAILIMIVGVINVLRLLPHPDEHVADSTLKSSRGAVHAAREHGGTSGPMSSAPAGTPQRMASVRIDRWRKPSPLRDRPDLLVPAWDAALPSWRRRLLAHGVHWALLSVAEAL